MRRWALVVSKRPARTRRYGAEAAGSFGRAGRRPTPPSFTAPPSHTPPRRCLRGFSAHAQLAHERTDRYACLRSGRWTGQCSLAHKDVAPLDCPPLRWAARRHSGPRRRGNALKQKLRLACTGTPPQGHSGQHRRRCDLPVLLLLLSPTPLTGLCGSPPLLLVPVAALPWASSPHGHRPATVSGVTQPAAVPLRSFRPPCKALQCNATGLLRQGPASLHTRGQPPRAGRQHRS
jgi:hypothetical protein